MFLEGAQVIVHALAGKFESSGDLGRGRRLLGEFVEEPAAHRVERHGGRSGIVDHRNVSHAVSLILDRNICQGRPGSL
ncbi:MAG: hypothetical protein R2697_20100 [Ilumatobacteraceae bacterium]